jgi:hypothetical protein
MGLFKALRTVLRVADKVGKVAKEVTPAIAVAEVVVDQVGDAVKPEKPKKKGK